MNAVAVKSRVDAMRAVRKAAGLKRRELYVHDDDWPQIAALAMKLQIKRSRAADKQKAG